MSSNYTIPLQTVKDQLQIKQRRGELPKDKPKGRVADAVSIGEVRFLIGSEPLRRDLLIEYLHQIQDHYACLQHRHLSALAVLIPIPLAEVYEVASFYHHFDIVREGEAVPPRLTVRVCQSLSCHIAGAADLLERTRAILGGEARVVPAPCIGRCEDAPAVLVGQNALGSTTPAEIREAVVKGQFTTSPLDDRGVFVPVRDMLEVADSLRIVPFTTGYSNYRRVGGYRLFQKCLSNHSSYQPEKVIKQMENAGLRGLGGAGFPTGRKWRILREQPRPKLMAVNIDEGEPGTFKDRTYLERDPHRFLEGMLIAAWATEIDSIYIYLRDEYHQCRLILERAIKQLQNNPPGPLPRIELRRGAGAYICGEESAMIESIEGKRGEPRLRPPYLAQVGLFGRPTLEHNFETLYWVRDILERGAGWFTQFGRHGRKGLRSFSVSGRVRLPGVCLAPAGITVQELIDEYCGGMQAGHEFYAYLPGGASGGILPATMGNIPLDFDTLQEHHCFIGSAAVIILSDQDKAREAALNIMQFFRDESCGQCTPCRVGTAKATALMQNNQWDQALLEDLSIVMEDASICGLGQAAPNPIRSVIRHFQHEITGEAL